MNILFLTYQGDLAGSTSSIAYLARGLSQKGHQVYVGCRQECLLSRMLSDSAVHVLPMTFKGKTDIINMRQIRDAVRAFSIDIINAQSSHDRYTSVLATWMYRLSVKLIHTRRQIPRSVGGWLQNALYVRGTDKIVAVSSGVKTALIELGIPSDHITVIPNGIHEEKYSRTFDQPDIEALKASYGIRDGEVVIGCISRKKQQEQLLHALQYIPFKTTVLFIGIQQADIDPHLLRSVQQTHHIIFCGLIAPEKVLQYYQLFAAHVLPSTIEGLSQTLLEAMAFGVPVIATRAGGNTDLIDDGENGFLFDDGNIQQLADIIQHVINNCGSIDTLIRRARKTAIEEFSMSHTVEKYEQFFTQLLRASDISEVGRDAGDPSLRHVVPEPCHAAIPTKISR